MISSIHNKTDVKRNNLVRVLEALMQMGPISRRELQKLTELSWGAISIITASLMEMGLIVETGPQDTPLGRKPAEIDVNPNDNFLVGIDLNILGLNVVVSDIKGRIKSKTSRLLLYSDREYILHELFDILDSVILSEYLGKRLLAVGVAAQGLVDLEKGVSMFVPHFINWENVPICAFIEERYHIPTYIHHDPDCVLFVERYFSAKYTAKSNNSVLVRLDKGIGMSLFINGEVYSGSTGKAAEFGHITMDADGPKCSCGKKGCLEVFASATGIVQRFYERINSGETTTVSLDDLGAVTHMTLYKAAKKGDELCVKLFQSVGFYIGLAIANIINLLNPGEVILYGSVAEMHDVYDEIMNETIRCNVFHNSNSTPIRYSKLDRDAPALGGALSAFSKHIRVENGYFSELQN